ncbi:carbohydrate kinase family protein [Trueperella bialowiezensis]|uniref:Ribokinase n=1 Tax=Trueperella bialowiezensis TaxID=312285 RepID=A0A448PDJ0_9ACTO|nr:carbohydrate kinase [Trueperella bialowiezensis]VEI12990.1 Ribokinase [Trueperella bialowiezensis]
MSCLVIGESLIDVVKRADGTASRHPGGSPMNVAVGLARLGRRVHLLTRFGDDADGSQLREYIESAGVSLYPGTVDSDATSIAIASINEAGSPAYHFDVNSAYVEPPASVDQLVDIIGELPTHVHIGSIGAHLRPGSHTVRRWLELLHEHATISYDPNVRLSILGSAQSVIDDMTQILPFVDIVKASTEDLEELTGHPVDPDAAAHEFLAAGATFVAISMGSRGVKFFTPTESVALPALQVKVVDSVGAGDAMMSALIDSLARISVLGDERAGLASISPSLLTSVGKFAVTAAAITVSRSGANPPTRDEVNELLASAQL